MPTRQVPQKSPIPEILFDIEDAAPESANLLDEANSLLANEEVQFLESQNRSFFISMG